MAVNVGQLLADGAHQLGKRYVFGTAGPHTFDCSGLVKYLFAKQGVSLPHSAEQQAKKGTAVPKDQIQAGDLVFSNWGDGPNSHVGIAVGPHSIINAPHTGAVVRYQKLSAGYLAHVTAVRRIANDGSVPTGSGIIQAGMNPFTAVADAIKDAAAPLVAVGKVSDAVFQVFMPSNFIRLVSGVFGFIFIAWGVLLLAREVRSG